MSVHALRRAIGQAIRRRRKALGLSQDAFAEVSGLHRTYIGGIERGERNITIDNLQRVACSLGVPLAQLIMDAEEMVIDVRDHEPKNG